jgi:hypothetical protein
MSFPDLPLQENHEWKHFRQKSRINALKERKMASTFSLRDSMFNSPLPVSFGV